MTLSVLPTNQTISWFNDRLAEDRLIFKPPFQRNPVWLPKHKAYLIDTVLRRLPIPEIYIQKETNAEGKTTYALVDGQQRVRTLLDFPRGDIELMEKFSQDRGGQTWEDLTDNEKRSYWDYALVVREIVGATDAELRDLFSRLNRHTVVLTQQELRNARYQGDFITTVTELADQAFWAEHRIASASEIRRMSDIEYVAELLLGLMLGPQNKKSGLDNAFEAYDEAIPNKQSFLRRFETARELSCRLVPELATSRWRGKSDYYSLFLSLDALSKDGRLVKEEACIKLLHSFGDEVTRELSKTSGRSTKNTAVRDYAVAVEKAASDKSRRETRLRILKELLASFFTKDKT